jgi:hypothetical protein
MEANKNYSTQALIVMSTKQTIPTLIFLLQGEINFYFFFEYSRSAPKLAVLVPSLKRDPETLEESSLLLVSKTHFSLLLAFSYLKTRL